MKTEIKYGQLRGLTNILDRIKKECRLPVVKALHLKRLIRSVTEEVTLYNDQYNEIIEKYAKKDEKGERIIQPSPTGDQVQLTDGNAFAKEMQELFEQTFEVDNRDVDVTIDDLNDMKMTVEEVEFLEFMFIERDIAELNKEGKVLPFPVREPND